MKEQEMNLFGWLSDDRFLARTNGYGSLSRVYPRSEIDMDGSTVCEDGTAVCSYGLIKE